MSTAADLAHLNIEIAELEHALAEARAKRSKLRQQLSAEGRQLPQPHGNPPITRRRFPLGYVEHPKPVVHGTLYAYGKGGCRCSACLSVARAAYRDAKGF